MWHQTDCRFHKSKWWPKSENGWFIIVSDDQKGYFWILREKKQHEMLKLVKKQMKHTGRVKFHFSLHHNATVCSCICLSNLQLKTLSLMIIHSSFNVTQYPKLHTLQHRMQNKTCISLPKMKSKLISHNLYF